MKKPNKCPSYNTNMYISEFHCDACSMSIKGKFQLSPFDCLDENEFKCVKIFLATGQKIKEMDRVFNISYPTV